MENLFNSFSIRPTLKALALFGFLFLSPPIQAINITWDGGAGDGNWNSPNNWNPNQVPTAADDVFLNGNIITLDVSSITVQSLEFGTALSRLTGTTNITVTNI